MNTASKIILFTVLFFTLKIGYTQTTSEKSWMEMLSNSTVSFGKDTVIDIRESNGVITKKRIFNIVGTGVIFYVKIFRKRDTIILPAVVTAKHVFHDPSANHFPKSLNVRFKWDEKNH